MRDLLKVLKIIQYLSLNHTRASNPKHASLPISPHDQVHVLLQAIFIQPCHRDYQFTLSAQSRSLLFDVSWFVEEALELLDLYLERPFLLFDGLYSGLLQHRRRW